MHNFLIDAYSRFTLRNNKAAASAVPIQDNAAALTNSAGDPILPHTFGDPGSAPVQFEFDRAAWAAQNDRFRKKAQEFLSCQHPRPCAQTVCLRMLLCPVQGMEKDEFWVGSQKYNRLEEAKSAKADPSRAAGCIQPGPICFCLGVLICKKKCSFSVPHDHIGVIPFGGSALFHFQIAFFLKATLFS